MDVSSIASLATSISTEKSGQAIGIAVLKKALDSEAQTASALIDSLPAPSSPNLPSHLGQNVNTVA